ncbi:hypothetical protein [Radicibacter daui]|uniref:hypothetical protein n=1 Tax=Radicibacter daui TaxID=3064829 RepID=UPI0040469B62
MAENYRLAAGGIELEVDLTVGHLAALRVESNGPDGHRILEPLHRAPWRDDPAIQADENIAPNVRRLAGDFFCAPFGIHGDGTDPVSGEALPPHGWPGNSRWQVVDETQDGKGGHTLTLALEKPVQGGRLIKELTLRDGHPFVYQRHIFEGGSGMIPVAHHVMTQFSGSGQLAFSPKRFAVTPPAPQETDPARGRSLFGRGVLTHDLTRLPGHEPGTSFDLTQYPAAAGHEDFVLLVEDPANQIGWTAALREEEQDMLITLRDARQLPVTMLWYSSAGRHYSPWNSRHKGVLGIEDGCALPGFAASGMSEAERALEQSIVQRGIHLNAVMRTEIRHVLGVFATSGNPKKARDVFAASLAGKKPISAVQFCQDFLLSRRVGKHA